MFLIPALFIFGGRLPFFIICSWKSWNEQEPCNNFLNAIFLHSYVAGLTFHKTKFYIDLFNATYLLRHIV